MHEGFKIAYTYMAKQYPCFGHAAKMPNIVWWKTCVRDSFVKAGYDYDEETFEKVFRRIYSTFGSAAPYTIFPDSQPFLRWARKQGLIVGIVSNAEYRYQDVILLSLGLNKKIPPEEVLHIGDSMRKDYIPATSLGMHGLLLDRFKTHWRDSGALVLPDLEAAVTWLTSEKA
ncbi:hypothetical protein MKW92_013966 [Papaver armeniacum]|nr:hypothetical protein MKW92_013966 [Papaver armeniacum]